MYLIYSSYDITVLYKKSMITIFSMYIVHVHMVVGTTLIRMILESSGEF